jgi:hypothetical protein
VLDWLAIGLSLIGAGLIARKILWGFASFCAGNALWIVWAIPLAQWSVLVVNVLFLLINIYGWVIWTREKHDVP